MVMDAENVHVPPRIPGVKYLRTFSNFFQSAKQRNANLGPDSGVHLVGPMFELMACIESRNTTDFDAYYPDSGLSYGPTICSFGLPYNDHNYAVPIGLTPPTMAPHLMDLIPVNVASSDKLSSEISISSPFNNYRKMESTTSTTASIKSVIATVQSSPTSKGDISELNLNVTKESIVNENLPPFIESGAHLLPIPTSITDETTTTTSDSKLIESVSEQNDTEIAASIAESIAGLSEPRKTLFGAWHTKAAATGGTLLVQHHWKDNHVPDREKRTAAKTTMAPNKPPSTKSPLEELECRYELEMKIIEVPDDICVSPSQLSGLDSDSEDEDENTLPYQNTIPEPAIDKTAMLPQTSIWLPVQCLCEMKMCCDKMLQCVHCRMLQHKECMKIIYRDGYTPTSTTKEGIVSMEKLLEPVTYLCQTCLNYPIVPAMIEGLQTCMQERPGMEPHYSTPIEDAHVIGDVQTKPLVGAAQLLANATDRARQLGLIVASGDKQESTWNMKKNSQVPRRATENTDVNLRIPSPPRASKRKQDLTNKSYNDTVRLPSDDHHNTSEGANSPSAVNTVSAPSDTPGGGYVTSSITPMSSTVGTPAKSFHSMQIYSTPGTNRGSGTECDSPISYRTSDNPGVSSGSTPTTSPMQSRKKPRRALFPDRRRKNFTDTPPSTLGSAWAKNYQEADVSIYSQALLSFIGAKIAAGRERNQRIQPTCLGRTPLCRVVLFDHDDKGLEASVRLSQGEVVSELRGNIMLQDEYEHFVDPTTEYNRYVMLYHDLGERDIAIDSTQYGNDARFIRRSCTPNCKLEHYVVCGKIRIIVRTTHEVLPGVELTLPFDPDYRSCRYPLTCACARSRCPVQKWCRKLVRHKVMPNLDYGKFITSRLRDLSQTLSDESSRSFVPADYSSATSSPVGKTDLSPIPNRQHLMRNVSVTLSPQRFTARSGGSSASTTPYKSPRSFLPVLPSVTQRQRFRPDSLTACPIITPSDLSTKVIVKAETPERTSLPLTETTRPITEIMTQNVDMDATTQNKKDQPSTPTNIDEEHDLQSRRKRSARILSFDPLLSAKFAKTSKPKSKRESPPHFKGIITTRRQAAAASSRISTPLAASVEQVRRRGSKRLS